MTFIKFLEEHFIGLNEVDGVPITKENFDDGFDKWLSELENQEIIDLAEEAIIQLKESK